MWDVGYEIHELTNLGRQISVVDFAFQNCPKDSRPSSEFPVLKFAIRNSQFAITSLCPMPYAFLNLQSNLFFSALIRTSFLLEVIEDAIGDKLSIFF